MGTNFYIYNQGIEARDGQHIGKRSAAGLYCWDCGVSLCRGGDKMVHQGGRYIMTHASGTWAQERAKEWHEVCPRCGQAPVKEGIEVSSAGRELGFNHETPERKRGVMSCASFSWEMEPASLEAVDMVVDEYGRLYTPSEFADVLKECPIRFLGPRLGPG